MLMMRPIIFLMTIGVGFPLLAQTESIKVGRYEVHPTRLLVRSKTYGEQQTQEQVDAQQNLLNRQGLQVSRQYSLVPGLQLLDLHEDLLNRQANDDLSEEDQARALLSRIKSLRDSGLYAYVTPDYVLYADVTPSDSRFVDGTLWGLQNLGQSGGTPGADISAPDAWDIATGSTNVIVAVSDTGIRFTHRDLSSQMWRNPLEIPGNGVDDDGNGYVDDVFGIDAILDSGNPLDDNGHGTHVAGTIGASANDTGPHVGVTWKVQLMACRFLGSQGGGLTSDAIQTVDYAVAHGAHIINASWGGGSFSQPLLDAITAAGDNNVLFVAAAGNAGIDNEVFPHYPSSYQVDNIIAVAATDRNDRLASFSNFGTNSVDIAAPGVEIFSTFSQSDISYEVLAGTSMATPHVSGVAALIGSISPSATIAEYRARLLGGADPLEELEDRVVSGGRLNAFKALNASEDGELEIIIRPPPGSLLLKGSLVTFTVTVTDLLPVNNATFANIQVNGQPSASLNFLNDGNPPDAVADDNKYTGTLDLTELDPEVETLTLSFEVSAPDKNTAAVSFDYEVLGRPENDEFELADKAPASGGVVTGRNSFATRQFQEPLHAGEPQSDASVWWNWSPNQDGPVLLDTAGTEFPAIAAVYKGNNIGALTEVASASQEGQRAAFLTFDVTRGQTYRIAIASPNANATGRIRFLLSPGGEPDTAGPNVSIDSPVSGSTVSTNTITVSGTALDPGANATGVSEVMVKVNALIADTAVGTTNWNYIVQLKEGRNVIQVFGFDFAGNQSQTVESIVHFQPPKPANDLLRNAAPLSGDPSNLQAPSGSVTGTNRRATKEVGEPLHAGNSGGHSVWWNWIAPADGKLTLSTENSTFDTLLAVYTGTIVSDLTHVASNDDFNAEERLFYSKLDAPVKKGQLYHIAVDGLAGSVGDIELSFEFEETTLINVRIADSEGGTVSTSGGTFIQGASVKVQANPNPGFVFVAWTGSFVSADNPLTFTAENSVNLQAVFRERTFTDDFETGDLTKFSWQTSGDMPWSVTDDEEFVSFGTFAAQSGDISDSQRSVLSLEIKTFSGTGGFQYRVSSEPVWDRFQFYLNGRKLLEEAGDVDWKLFQFNLKEGLNRLEWRYVKDSIRSEGADAVFIDNLDLPVVPAVSEETAAELQLVTREGIPFKVTIFGQPGQRYTLQASSNLKDWVDITTEVAPNGLLIITDTDSVEAPMRFYRAVVRE